MDKSLYMWQVLGLIVLLLAPLRPAQATDRLDLSVGLKTLPLLTSKLASPAPTAVIYDSDAPQSKADAEAIVALLDGDLEAPGGTKLTPVLISTAELPKLAAIKIAILAQGLPVSDLTAISAAASKYHVLSISTDLDCVKGNACVLGVVSKPRVEIYYSRAAAEAAQIEFASAFTMLAKQM